jgi:hypothetical protein
MVSATGPLPSPASSRRTLCNTPTRALSWTSVFQQPSAQQIAAAEQELAAARPAGSTDGSLFLSAIMGVGVGVLVLIVVGVVVTVVLVRRSNRSRPTNP